MGHFLCGVETAKRFVNVHLHCNHNCRQKVVNREALRLCDGALRSCRGRLAFKFDENSTN